MDVFKFFDAYFIRARLFPAIVAAAPALAAVALLISWKTFGLSNMISSVGILVLLWAIADFARERGRAIENSLFAEHGGMPSITMFRRNDSTIDGGSKDRYCAFLAGKLGVTAPSAEDETANQEAADSYYAQCGNWLRQNTRDTKKFSLLFGENMTYGFRRNLLGVKSRALALNALVVVICIGLLWRMSWDFGSNMGSKTTVVLVVAAAHATYMLMAVNRAAVWDAAKGYGRELILCCEAFLSQESTPAKKPTAKKAASKASITGTPPA